MTTPSETPGWNTTAITPRTEFIQGVGPVPGFDVGFTTTSGITASVWVTTAQAGNPATVRNLIATRVQQLHALHTLSG